MFEIESLFKIRRLLSNHLETGPGCIPRIFLISAEKFWIKSEPESFQKKYNLHKEKQSGKMIHTTLFFYILSDNKILFK